MPKQIAPVSFPRPGQALRGGVSDARLVRQAASGDRPAFAAIFERHHQAIYRYCRSILRNEEDAADALQNTMAAAMRSLEGETREIALKAWLFRIAHNESLSLLRRRRPHTPMDDVDLPARMGLEAEVLASERMRELVSDLHALPDRQRGALVMRELSGLEYAEIAAVFGVAEGAARQAVHEAREMLHEFGEGRAIACADIRERISACDGRLLRGRKVRAHLRACAGCREFRRAIPARTAGLAALAPPLGVPIAATMLEGLLGAGGSGGAGLTASGATVVTASAATTNAVTGVALTAKVGVTAGLVAKAAPVLAAGAALSGGAVAAEHQFRSDPARPAPASQAADAPRPRDAPGPRDAQPAALRIREAAQQAPVPALPGPPGTPGEGSRTTTRTTTPADRAGPATPAAPYAAPPASERAPSTEAATQRPASGAPPSERAPAAERPAGSNGGRPAGGRPAADRTPATDGPTQQPAARPTPAGQPPATQRPATPTPNRPAVTDPAPTTRPPVSPTTTPTTPAPPSEPPDSPDDDQREQVNPATPPPWSP